LKQAGVDVRVVSHQDFEPLVCSHGLAFLPVPGDIQNIVQGMAMRERIEGGNFLLLMAEMAKEAKRGALALAKSALAASRDADLLLAWLGGVFVGLAVVERLEIPLVQAYLVPFTPTEEFASPLVPRSPAWLGGYFNRLSHHMTRQLMWQGFRAADRLARREVVGVPAAPFWGPFGSEAVRSQPVLYGFSSSVILAPAGWAGRASVTGYWFLDSAGDWVPPASLTAFLAGGPSPVYIGFGSMGRRHPEATAALVVEAVQRIGVRAVLLSGWGGLQPANLPETIYALESIPHAWLFPQMAALVHHGGAGTTGAALRAGVPSVVVPFFGDQPFWCERISALGVGPRPLPNKALSPDRLVRAIDQALTDHTMRARAAELGEKIRAEDGIARAVDIIVRD
jgi:UDP:flavonoid glycosyltransferase YjiC (YdhE family)